MSKIKQMTALVVGACSLFALAAQADAPSLGYVKHSLDGKTATFLGIHPRWSPPYMYKLETKTINPPMDIGPWRELTHDDYRVGMAYTSDAWEYIFNLDPAGRYNDFRLVQYSYEGVRLSDSGSKTVASPTETIEFFEPSVTEHEITYEYRVRGSVNIQMSDSSNPGGNWQTVTTIAHSPILEPTGYAHISCSVGPYDPHYTRLEVITDSGTTYTAASLIEVPLPSGPEPPAPNPAAWDVEPVAGGTTIAMRSVTGSTTNGPVEYYFAETSGNAAGFDSGWQAASTYTASGLNPMVEYTYRVRMRDASGNVGSYSIEKAATTGSPMDPPPIIDPPDTEPPTPNPAQFAAYLEVLGDESIRMWAITGSDPNGVEYYFEEISGNPGGSDSGWQASDMYIDDGLQPGTTYSYRVRMRDNHGNTGEYSSIESATTQSGPPQDTEPPTPNPAQFAAHLSADSTSATMWAITGSDPNGVEYYFEEISGNPGGSDSGWQASDMYIDDGLQPITTYRYRLRMRDSLGNVGEYSSIESVTTEEGMPPVDIYAPTPNPAQFAAHLIADTTSITMWAVEGSDPNGVEYYFEELSGNPGGSDSGWQASDSYVDTGLLPGTTYSYRVRMRDSLGNVGDYSSVEPATTEAVPDWTEINFNNFESSWGIWNDGGSDCRRSYYDRSYALGNYCIRLRDNSSSSVMTTDNLALAGSSEVKVSFSYYPRSMDNSNEDFWLQISLNGGLSYTTVEEWNRDDEFVNNQRYSDTVTISGFSLNNETRLRFRCDASGDADYVYIDEVSVSAK